MPLSSVQGALQKDNDVATLMMTASPNCGTIFQQTDKTQNSEVHCVREVCLAVSEDGYA